MFVKCLKITYENKSKMLKRLKEHTKYCKKYNVNIKRSER